MIKLKDLLPEKFASKAQQGYMFATNPDAAKKLASKMTKKDYEDLPDKVKEGDCGCGCNENSVDEIELAEKKKKKKAKRDKCYYKVKRRYKVWPSAYGSLALSACRKVGADVWGEKSKGN